MADSDIEILIDACSALPPPKGNYLIDDFVSNMILTLHDLQMHTTAVERAFQFFDENGLQNSACFGPLKQFSVNVGDDQTSLEAAARHLWSYHLWTRVRWLRDLLLFFESQALPTKPLWSVGRQ